VRKVYTKKGWPASIFPASQAEHLRAANQMRDHHNTGLKHLAIQEESGNGILAIWADAALRALDLLDIIGIPLGNYIHEYS
jgi:hypothetical protein